MLYVTWIFKRSGACFKRLVCFRGGCVLYVTGIFKGSGACCM